MIGTIVAIGVIAALMALLLGIGAFAFMVIAPWLD